MPTVLVTPDPPDKLNIRLIDHIPQRTLIGILIRAAGRCTTDAVKWTYLRITRRDARHNWRRLHQAVRRAQRR